jgi:hypothetical protein
MTLPAIVPILLPMESSCRCWRGNADEFLIQAA